MRCNRRYYYLNNNRNRSCNRQQYINRKQQQNGSTTGRCTSPLAYVGNVFVLGLATLVGELVDIQAANALDVLLDPFQCDTGENIQQDILTSDIQDTDIIDLLDGLI